MLSLSNIDLSKEVYTFPCSKFFSEHGKITNFVEYIASMAVHISWASHIAENALNYDPTKPEQNESEYELKMEGEDAHPALVKLGKYNYFIRELMLSRSVDNYLAYIAELLFLIYKTRPDMLKSSEQITIEAVLKHSSMDELLVTLAEKKVHELSYQGIKELSNYLKSKTNLVLFSSSEELEKAIEIIEIRNLIIHNRGVVNNVYLKKTQHKHYKAGDKIALSFELVGEYLAFLTNSVKEIDKNAIRQFSLYTL
jgi:hypothetical protein